MARKFYNPRTYPIHVDDGQPVAPGDTFTGDPDADEWLQVLLAAGDAMPVTADRADDDVDAAQAAVAGRAADAAQEQARGQAVPAEAGVKVQPAAASGDNEGVPAKQPPKEKQS